MAPHRWIAARIVRLWKGEDGSGVPEYGMLIVVVVLGAALTLGGFRSRVSTWYVGIAAQLTDVQNAKAGGGPDCGKFDDKKNAPKPCQ